MKSPDAWVRPHIKELAPYTSARDRCDGARRLLLDANENPFAAAGHETGQALNRYPDPQCGPLRAALASWLGIEPDRLWLGNGSDEALDVLVRTFVDPGEPVVVCTPTYGMYEVTARAHDAEVRRVPLDDDFDLDVPASAAAARGAKLVFICSPNNPTGNLLSPARVEELARAFDGLVVVDEAYVEFSGRPSLIDRVAARGNLAVLRTFSKAWGLAAARVGYLVADPRVVEYLDRVDLPYPLSALSAQVALRALENAAQMARHVAKIVAERARLTERLEALGLEVFPSDANFVLVRVPNAAHVHRRLAEGFGIVVRDRSDIPRLEDCLRITAGRAEDTDRLCAALEAIGR